MVLRRTLLKYLGLAPLAAWLSGRVEAKAGLPALPAPAGASDTDAELVAWPTPKAREIIERMRETLHDFDPLTERTAEGVGRMEAIEAPTLFAQSHPRHEPYRAADHMCSTTDCLPKSADRLTHADIAKAERMAAEAYGEPVEGEVSTTVFAPDEVPFRDYDGTPIGYVSALGSNGTAVVTLTAPFKSWRGAGRA